MIRATTLMAICALFAADAALAQSSKLLEQIEQNRQTLILKAPLTLDATPVEELPAARLWFHVRSDRQGVRATRLAATLEAMHETGEIARGIELRPVQTVNFGPSEGQIRYFKEEDEATAQQIADIAGDMGLTLEPVSMVEKFADVDWIEVGHLEIWFPSR